MGEAELGSHQIEDGDEAYDMRLLPFYEACWMCMCLAQRAGTEQTRLREVSNWAKCPWDFCGIFEYAFAAR